MAGFKFKMQNILNLKENIEKDKKNQLGAAIQRLENEKSKLRTLEQRLSEQYEVLKSETEKGIAAGELKLYMGYIEYYKKSITNQRVKIKMANDYVDTCRQELIEATKARKMIEKLREVELKRYLYEEQKKEDKLVDDLVTFKEGRKNSLDA